MRFGEERKGEDAHVIVFLFFICMSSIHIHYHHRCFRFVWMSLIIQGIRCLFCHPSSATLPDFQRIVHWSSDNIRRRWMEVCTVKIIRWTKAATAMVTRTAAAAAAGARAGLFVHANVMMRSCRRFVMDVRGELKQMIVVFVVLFPQNKKEEDGENRLSASCLESSEEKGCFVYETRMMCG